MVGKGEIKFFLMGVRVRKKRREEWF